MTFKNKPNKWHELLDGRIVWESRSIAVNGVIMIMVEDYEESPGPYVLVSERGPNSADYIGLWNNVAGYLDWDESGPEAFERETWEEVGINIHDLMQTSSLIYRADIVQPWHVQTEPIYSRQNVSLRYGLFTLQKWFPLFNTANNEVEGEIGEIKWLHVDDLHLYEWAFEHDEVIKSYCEINKIKVK